MSARAGLAIGLRAALFFTVIAALAWFSNIEPGRRFMVAPVTEVSAVASRLVISAFGGDVHSEGTVLYGSGGALDIKDGCNGIIAMILYAGAVVAHEAKAVAKLIGLAFGIPAIWVVNLIRIVCLYVVSEVAPSSLEFFHIYFFQTFIIICVVALWFVWAMWCQGGAGRVARAPAPGPMPADGTTPSGTS